MNYPGKVLKVGALDATLVNAVISRLASRGYRQTGVVGGYDAALASLVKLFQSQNADAFGRPLTVDGQIGPLTWAALFGSNAVATAGDGLAAAALARAVTQIGVMESPLGSNSGPEVDAYLKSVGLDGGYFWCMAFVHWCFSQAAKAADLSNPFPRTAGCLDAWNKIRPARRITRAKAIANPGLVKPGLVFILDYGGGHGHTGFVKHSTGGALRTVEGNTNPQASGNGVGVFALSRRSVMDPSLKGFIDFT